MTGAMTGTSTERSPVTGERPPILRVGPGLRSPFALALGCHGNPDRCLRLGRRTTPICARCVGIVAGNLTALPWFALSGLPGGGAMLAGLLLLVPAALDGGLQAATRYRSTPPRRLATGLLAGFGQALVVVGLLGPVLGLPSG